MKLVRAPNAETVEQAAQSIEVGQWYRVLKKREDGKSDEDDEPDLTGALCCVVHIGSNYAQLESVDEQRRRIHFTDFDDVCVLASDADRTIQAQIKALQEQVKGYLAEVQRLSMLLSVNPNPVLGEGPTEALVRAGAGRDMKEYGEALVRAKDKELPELFEKISSTHEELARWMTAPTLPLRAQARSLERVVETIDGRVFDVSLYAGLTEEVVQISEGAPAAVDAKVHLMQRRHYMDEECLISYEAGGMEFKQIHSFDKWLARPANRDRILPFPRCLVAFRVRRIRKEREITSLADFIRFMGIEDADKLTFLYIRNGENLYRMDTDLDFDEKLFPDLDRQQLAGKLWASVGWSNGVNEIITDNEYQGLLEEDARERAEWQRKRRALPKSERWQAGFQPHQQASGYVAYSPDNVHFDDISRKIQGDIRKHNRIALIIQGLLDRSAILHPHLPHKLWTPEGFRGALELVYDDTRALAPAELPDFEAYRAEVNRTLGKGSITVGQEDAWARAEAVKENERLDRSWRSYERSAYRPEKHFPYGNPGPGLLAEVHAFSRKGQTCTFTWQRDRLHRKRGAAEVLKASFTMRSERLLNVSAYRPGDYLRFYADPRTRAAYLKWAPLLLVAEDFHAGKRQVGNRDGYKA